VGASFALFGAPTGTEGEALQGFIDVYNEVTGSSITFRGSTDFENELRIAVDGGNPPDVAVTPQPASICEFANQGHLVALEDMGFDIAEMEANHSKFWMDLGLCEDGKHYGIPWFPNYKSVVFYHIPTFEENGYEVPETYEDLVALSEQMVADGLTPWCFGYGAGGATGWAGTDWIEDIFLRLHGAEAYSQWYKHEIPFNDPMVVEAFELFSQILHGEGFVLGGAENVPSIVVEESPAPMFQEPPGCVMLKQGSFASNFFPDAPEYEEGEEAESASSTSRPSTATPGRWVAVTRSSCSTTPRRRSGPSRTGSRPTGSAPWLRPPAVASRRTAATECLASSACPAMRTPIPTASRASRVGRSPRPSPRPSATGRSCSTHRT
jgi:ABC-type sugar transport system, periplasmic component